MIDLDTFLTTLYVMVDDFCQSLLPVEQRKPGPQASWQRGEGITLALFGQWVHFLKSNERFIAMPSSTCEPPFPSCRIAASSIA